MIAKFKGGLALTVAILGVILVGSMMDNVRAQSPSSDYDIDDCKKS